MKKRLLSAVLVVSLAASVLQGCKIGNTEYVWDTRARNNDFVFTINENGCGEKEARLYLCNYKNLYGKEYGIDLWNYEFEDASLEDYVKDVTLDELVRILCMNLIAQEKQMELTEDEKDDAKLCAEKYYETLTEDEKDYIGASLGDIEEFYEHYALAMKLYKSLTEDVNSEVSDDDARVVRVMQIMVEDSATASTVESKIKNGDEFEALVSTYNSAKKDEIAVARGELSAELEKVIFDLNTDEVSGRVQTEDGIYFFKCISKNDEKLTEANKEVIKVQREEQQFNEAYDNFNNNASYSLNEKIWKRVKIDSELEINTDSFFAIYDEYF